LLAAIGLHWRSYNPGPTTHLVVFAEESTAAFTEPSAGSPVHSWQGGMRSRSRTAVPANCFRACPHGLLLVRYGTPACRSEWMTQRLANWIFAGLLGENGASGKCARSRSSVLATSGRTCLCPAAVNRPDAETLRGKLQAPGFSRG